VIHFSDPFCSGEIFTHPFLFPPLELKPQTIGPLPETAKSPSDCGNDPHTTVTYGIQAVQSNIKDILHHHPPPSFP
jgi:hypothetical protein